MSISVGNYSFEGPYTTTDSLDDKSGIYAIHCKIYDKYYLIDVGESSQVKSRVANHDRKDCWTKNCKGTLTVSVYYTPNLQQAGRRLIEQELRSLYDPICGKQ
ncbi:MAG: hypothetical protein PHN88_01500 [Ignavibacteria bacterium]|nr:hypothetical protein [Ignavibacteria bacterium]